MANTHPRGLDRGPGAATLSAREPAAPQQRPSGSQKRLDELARPTSSEIRDEVIQRLREASSTGASGDASTGVRSPATVGGPRLAKRPSPGKDEGADADEACASDSTPSKKRRARQAQQAGRPRAKAALDFASDWEKGSDSGSERAQQAASAGGMEAERGTGADVAAEQPMQQTASKGGRGRKDGQGEQAAAQKLQPRSTRASAQPTEVRQLRPRPAPAVSAPVTPAKPAEAPARPRGQSQQPQKETAATESGAAAKTAKRVPLQECKVDKKYTYRVGDCAYVITDDDFEVGGSPTG